MKYIAVSQRVHVMKNIKERRDALSQEWATLSLYCGFLPILLPNNLEVVKNLITSMSIGGFLLTGGNDLVSYGGDTPERDQVERFLVSFAIDHKIPLLGVCRGMQILLDYFNIPLIKVDNHVATEHHLNNGDTVNSYHHFGVRCCKAPLKALCYSDDGVVEEVIHSNYSWIRGIMWHPERYHPFRDKDLIMIKELFKL